ncbi:hypothetical protein ACKI14_02260 [Streptomyces turgidiscabies]|uniref:hypothetical protein n=1 Tax=Streptomyces turgidiscabies TaxID=85558 RepID=UPI0038F7A42E
MSAPTTHDPLVVNTKDGTTWSRRAVTQDGHGLYAVTDSCKCPEYLLATLAELAERGIVGSAHVLPVPTAPEPQPLSAARLAEAEERGAHLYEFGGDATADEWNRLAGDDVPLLVAEVRRQAVEIAELNESVTTSAEALRARPSCPCPPADQPGPHQLGCPLAEVPVSGSSMEESADRLTAFFAPVAALREDVSPQVAKLRNLLAVQRAAVEDPHDGPLAHPYRIPRDLPDLGGGA